jgi:type VI secretion system protein ImpA
MIDVEALLAETKESPPCGPNLEHDLSFFEFEEAARPRPEQRIGDSVKPGEDPKWPKVIELACGLLPRTKDIRVAVHLTRALTCTDGLPGLAVGLALVRGILERYWDHAHPVLESDNDNDPTERMNALSPLGPPGFADQDPIITDVRRIALVNSREHGQLQVREVEIALGRLAPTPSANSAPPKPLDQIHSQLRAAYTADHTVLDSLREAHQHVLALQALIIDRVGGERAVDLKPLAQSLECLLEVCDTSLGLRAAVTAGAAGAGSPAAPGLVDGAIRSRLDAVHMLDLVCDFLEQHEPSNPAPLFIRRAQRLMTKNFVEIVKDLLPDSLSNLERLAGELASKQGNSG